MHAAARQAYEQIAELITGDSTFQRYHDACEAIGITPPMLKAMLALEPGQARPMRHLAESLRCDASWVTSLVDALEARHFVERRPSAHDRRVKTVALTEAGAMAKKRAVELLYEPPPSFAKLTAAEARQLRDLLRKARPE